MELREVLPFDKLYALDEFLLHEIFDDRPHEAKVPWGVDDEELAILSGIASADIVAAFFCLALIDFCWLMPDRIWSIEYVDMS